MCKMFQKAKYGEKKQMVKKGGIKDKQILNFLFVKIVTTLYPPHHAQNEVSWGGPWECTNMHKSLDQFWHHMVYHNKG